MPATSFLAAGLVAASLSAGDFDTSFTVAVLPDTQNFSRDNPAIYEAMTRWIVENREARNIVFVSHVGDIVNNGPNLRQWANARAAMNILAAGNVPYGVAMGNHDNQYSDAEFEYPPEFNNIDPSGQQFRDFFGADTLYDPARPGLGTFADQPFWLSTSPTGLSSAQLIDAPVGPGTPAPLLFLHLEVDARDTDLAWAEQVIDSYPERLVILTTHRYLLDYRGIRGRYADFAYGGIDQELYYPDANDAETIFNTLVKAKRNVMAVMCGHVDGEYRQTSVNDAGLPVFEFLQDYQSFSPNGGDGWLRLYEFNPSDGTIRVETFSPTAAEGGRLRTQDDQVAEVLTALNDLGPGLFAMIGPALATIPPQFLGLLQGLFAQPGAASLLILAIQKDPAFAGLIGQFLGLPPAQAQQALAGFPFEDLTPGFINVLDTDGPVLFPLVFSGDLPAFTAFFEANGGAKVREAFFSDNESDPSFVIEGVDFNAYLGVYAGCGGIGGPAPCSVADLAAPCGTVDINDILIFAGEYDAGSAIADISGDAEIDINDILSFADAFDNGCP